MRRISATFTFLLIVIPAYALAQNSLDGYFWEKSNELKPLILAFFLGGYAQGRIQGTVDSTKFVGDELAKYPPHELDTDAGRIRVTVAFALLEASRVALRSDILKKSGRDVGFYQREIDAFYQTFPLCKRLNIFLMLSDLQSVWEEKTSYKELGAKCLESPNK